jgi:hypothetical protein
LKHDQVLILVKLLVLVEQNHYVVFDVVLVLQHLLLYELPREVQTKTKRERKNGKRNGKNNKEP